jgi:two-component system, sensor histidine kinase and response regulator
MTSLAQHLETPETIPGKLESLVNACPVAMFICKAGDGFPATFITEGVRTLWGYDPKEFLDQPSFWADCIHPEDVTAFFSHLERVLEHDRYSHEYRFRAKSGEYRWTHDELRVVRDAAGNPLEVVGYCFDVTDQKTAEAALRESEELQKVIFNSTSDLQALFRVEPADGFVTEAVNRAMTENLGSRMGQNAADFLGKDFRELLAATGLSRDEIEARRSLYRQVSYERTTARFDTPASARRDALEVSVSPVVDQKGHCTHLLWNGRNISKRMEAEAQRRESEERYALVTEAIHEGIFDWNLVTGVSYLSPRYKEILGFRDDELPNDETAFFGRIHPEDSARMLETRARYNEDLTRDRFLDELRLRHRDGTYRWVVSRGRIVRDDKGEPIRIVGAIGDMTDRLESAAKLAASEKRLRDILDSLFGFVGLFTLEGKLIECSQAALNAVGVQPEDWLGRPFWEIGAWRSPEDRTRVKEMMTRAGQGEVVRFEASATVGQREMISDITFGPLRDQQGTVCNIIGHGVDITARKKAEAELIHAKEAAESSSRAKSEFLANMSHEIRTPMNGVIGLTEVLLDTHLDAEQREYLTLVKSSAESLMVIINDILDVSKIEAGKLRLETTDLDLRDLVVDILRVLKVSADVKGLSLVSDIDSDVPAVVQGDPGRLKQILINLIGNAIKFTDQGQVAVAIKRSPEDTDALHFSVRDTGIGIPADKRAMIFEAFTQVDGSYTRRFGGTGLGLTIASRLVRMMHGRIWVDSEEGEGSTFHFTAVLGPGSTGNSQNSIGPAGL